MPDYLSFDDLKKNIQNNQHSDERRFMGNVTGSFSPEGSGTPPKEKPSQQIHHIHARKTILNLKDPVISAWNKFREDKAPRQDNDFKRYILNLLDIRSLNPALEKILIQYVDCELFVNHIIDSIIKLSSDKRVGNVEDFQNCFRESLNALAQSSVVIDRDPAGVDKLFLKDKEEYLSSSDYLEWAAGLETKGTPKTLKETKEDDKKETEEYSALTKAIKMQVETLWNGIQKERECIQKTSSIDEKRYLTPSDLLFRQSLLLSLGFNIKEDSGTSRDYGFWTMDAEVLYNIVKDFIEKYKEITDPVYLRELFTVEMGMGSVLKECLVEPKPEEERKAIPAQPEIVSSSVYAGPLVPPKQNFFRWLFERIKYYLCCCFGSDEKQQDERPAEIQGENRDKKPRSYMATVTSVGAVKYDDESKFQYQMFNQSGASVVKYNSEKTLRR